MHTHSYTCIYQRQGHRHRQHAHLTHLVHVESLFKRHTFTIQMIQLGDISHRN